MGLVDYIRHEWRILFPKIPSEKEMRKREEETLNHIIGIKLIENHGYDSAAVAISILKGEKFYTTKEDVDELREKVMGYEFKSHYGP